MSEGVPVTSPWREAEMASVRARPAARSWDDAAVEAAVDEGDRAADDALAGLVRDHGERRPEDYVADLGLKVVAVGFSDRWPLPYFAVYDEATSAIEVNIKLIRDLDRHLKATGRAGWVQDGRLRQVAIAHELFHHLTNKPQPKLTLRQRWQQRDAQARADVVEEIAAVRFSQLLVGIDYSPLEYTKASRELAATDETK